MPGDDDIPDWSRALSPVSAGEVRELRRFVSQVEKLRDCSLFKAEQDTLKISGGVDEPWEVWHEAEKEPVMAATTVFRQLYTPNEHGSARRASNIVKRSAHAAGGPEAAKLIALIKHHEAGLRAIDKANGGFAIKANGQDLYFKEIIDLLVNAEVMHNDVEKEAVFKELEGFVRFQFVGALVEFRARYWLMRNCVQRCLEEPTFTAQAA